jgi:hypothetical protein
MMPCDAPGWSLVVSIYIHRFNAEFPLLPENFVRSTIDILKNLHFKMSIIFIASLTLTLLPKIKQFLRIQQLQVQASVATTYENE